jgi:hypothetical protein
MPGLPLGCKRRSYVLACSRRRGVFANEAPRNVNTHKNITYRRLCLIKVLQILALLLTAVMIALYA